LATERKFRWARENLPDNEQITLFIRIFCFKFLESATAWRCGISICMLTKPLYATPLVAPSVESTSTVPVTFC